MIERHRKVIEQKYRGEMWVSEFAHVEIDGEDLQRPVEVIAGSPCYLKRGQMKPVNPNDANSEADYTLKLIYAPEIIIKAGSLVRVVQDGTETKFKYSGEAFSYPTHNEIIIRRSDFA